jgi:hypothetical protein
MRGETVDVSALDDATRSAFSSWKAQHSSDRGLELGLDRQQAVTI